MSEIPPVPEKISERKIIVYKSRVDPTIVKLTAEKMKYKLFTKFSFSQNQAEEIRVVSVDKYYEPYVLIDAKYDVHYYKTKLYSLGVDPETEEVKISEKSYTPEVEPAGNGAESSRKVIKLEAKMYASYNDKAYIVLDSDGNEIPPDQVPAAPSEDNPEEILKEFNKKTGDVKLTPQKEINMVKARIVKRPENVGEIEDELFHVSEHAVVYSPFFVITFRNEKTAEEKIIKIDGVTAKVIS
ncbi:MAG: hypothetical protein IAX21_05715 [Candidatus Bathyarchaeota archaeon]|nr:hypothetical protein [Candidatus Bathyarchaeum tardum]WGM89550.1 MAG: hypothetical protein NUK63_00030 [Candidatus Bathyarchaeum tardum]WNZ30338.1 MAG: hypothetical protein IAX21_05715 [Candidatus Bathyarchaeota archaeon]